MTTLSHNCFLFSPYIHVHFREGAHEVLTSLGSFPGIVDAIQTGLLKVVTTISDCTVTK